MLFSNEDKLFLSLVTSKPCPQLAVVPHWTLFRSTTVCSAINSKFEAWQNGFATSHDHVISPIQLSHTVSGKMQSRTSRMKI